MSHPLNFWTPIYEKQADSLRQLCIRYVGNRPLAEDLVQETFLTAMARYDSYRGKGPLGAWLRRIAINIALKHLRSQRRSPEESWDGNHLEEQFPAIGEASGNLIEQANFSQEELLHYLDQLPDRYRLVFNLYVLDGLKHREIAQLLDITPGTSKSNLARARQRLAQQLTQEAQNRPKKRYQWAFLFMLSGRSIDRLFRKAWVNPLSVGTKTSILFPQLSTLAHLPVAASLAVLLGAGSLFLATSPVETTTFSTPQDATIAATGIIPSEKLKMIPMKRYPLLLGSLLATAATPMVPVQAVANPLPVDEIAYLAAMPEDHSQTLDVPEVDGQFLKGTFHAPSQEQSTQPVARQTSSREKTALRSGLGNARSLGNSLTRTQYRFSGLNTPWAWLTKFADTTVIVDEKVIVRERRRVHRKARQAHRARRDAMRDRRRSVREVRRAVRMQTSEVVEQANLQYAAADYKIEVRPRRIIRQIQRDRSRTERTELRTRRRSLRQQQRERSI